MGVVLYIFLQLWKLTYRETGAELLGGLTLPQMLWYLAITEAIVTSRGSSAREIDQDIRTGAVTVLLIRPISYPLYRLWMGLGERIVRFALNAIVGIIVASLFVGLISLSWIGLALFAIAIPLAFIADFLGVFLVALCAFWLEDTTGLILIYSRISMVLGGTLIPIELFPENWQPLLRNLPFSSIVYGPARLFVHPDLTFLGELVLRQGIFILVLGMCVSYVYTIAIKQINANGG